ncbi:phage portal protein [Plantibacter flavus]|uniref:phage portal protein n=1 Tax=Plantibacter flavus TaxID=150123 RepID=UPI0009C3D970|nr:phage portal protein [Plantibacter flavus]AQX81486.1 phage portal protein [Plantibacter flavus]
MSTFKDWFLGTDRTPTHEQRAEEPTAEAPGPSDPTDVRPPSRAAAPRSVGTAEAFGLSMVYRAIQIHAVSAKQMSIDEQLYGQPVEKPSAFMRRPSRDLSRGAFVEQNVVSLAAHGNAYWGLDFDSKNVIGNVDVWNPNDVQIETNPAGRIVMYHHRGKEVVPAKVKHLPLLRVPGTAYGLGPIQAAQQELRGALDTRDYSSNWFRDSGTPDGILKSDQQLNKDSAAAARKQWEETQGGRRGVAVLGAGLDYRPIFLKPADVQFIESQQFNVTQVARLFGVPSSLMLATVEGNSQSYSNVEQDWLAYVRFTLMSYLVEIEDALSDLLPLQRRAKFNVEAFLRTDTTTRYSAHASALGAGWTTINEVRAIEGLAALPDGDRVVPKPTKTPEEPAA